MTLKISGLPGNWQNETLHQFLESYADLTSVRIVFDPITEKSKRFGFVEVTSRADANRLIAVFNGKILPTGQVLKMEEYRRKP